MLDKENQNKKYLSELPHEFLIEVALKDGEKSQHAPDWFRKRSLVKCDYHEHASELDRVECKSSNLRSPELATLPDQGLMSSIHRARFEERVTCYI
jgi:hypothetical protein